MVEIECGQMPLSSGNPSSFSGLAPLMLETPKDKRLECSFLKNQGASEKKQQQQNASTEQLAEVSTSVERHTLVI